MGGPGSGRRKGGGKKIHKLSKNATKQLNEFQTNKKNNPNYMKNPKSKEYKEWIKKG